MSEENIYEMEMRVVVAEAVPKETFEQKDHGEPRAEDVAQGVAQVCFEDVKTEANAQVEEEQASVEAAQARAEAAEAKVKEIEARVEAAEAAANARVEAAEQRYRKGFGV